MSQTQIILLIALFFVLTGNISGAFGSHYLKEILAPERLAIWETGVRYQMYNALGLVGVSWITLHFHHPFIPIGAVILALGTFLFAASLCLLALTNLKFWAFITPIGGTLIVISWAVILVGVWKASA